MLGLTSTNKCCGRVARGLVYLLTLLIVFPILATSSRSGPLIHNASGQRIHSVFEGLRPSPLVGPRHLYTAATMNSCQSTKPINERVPRGNLSATGQLLQVSANGESGRYLRVQSNCGGHYATCIEDFCTIDCFYLFCWSGGSDYNLGWKTHYWNGCCYGDIQCTN